MRRAMIRLAMWMFILSEGIFFLLLVLAYVAYHRQQGSGPTAAGSLDLGRTAIFSACLFSSSGSMAWAARSFQRGARARFGLGLLLTLVLGGAFLTGQAVEYAGLLHQDVTISRNLFGTTFFTLTGFHGLHVAVGLCLLLALLGFTVVGHRTDPWPGAVEGVSLYWHFVDVVWVVIFSVVYLWAFL